MQYPLVCEQAHRDIARVETGGARGRRGLLNEAGDPGRVRRRCEDERAAAMLRLNESLSLEAPVNGKDGVDVDADRSRQLAGARQAISGLQHASGDQHAQPPSQLSSHGHLA